MKPIKNKEKDIHPKDNNNNYVYSTLKFQYEQITLPSNTYKEVLVQSGVSKSKAKEVINALNRHVHSELIKLDKVSMDKIIKFFLTKPKEQQDNYIKTYKKNNKDYIREYNYSKILGELNLQKLPLSLIRYKYELSLLI